MITTRKVGLFTYDDRKEEDKKPDLYYERLKHQANLEKARGILRIVNETELKQSNFPEVLRLLLEAIKLGCEEAGNDLLRVLFERSRMTKEVGLTNVLKELEHCHTYNAIAARCLGEIYAGFGWSSEDDNQLFLPLLPEEGNRAVKAIQYLKIAIQQGNDKARIFLAEAFRTGEKGCIVLDVHKWVELNKGLADRGNQMSASDYALFLEYTWKKAMDKETKDVDMISHTLEEALAYFLKATQGKNWTIAHEAIVKICDQASFILSQGGSLSLTEIFDKEAHLGNSFIALYLAFCYCPTEGLPRVSLDASPPPQLRELIIETEKQTTSLEKTRKYLILASVAEDSLIKKVAVLFYESLDKTFPVRKSFA